MGMVIYPTVHGRVQQPIHEPCHIGIFSFRVHKAPISTHKQKCLFCIIILKPNVLFKNLIHVCYLRFFSANLVAPQTEWPLPSNGIPLGSPRRQIQIPSGQALHDPGLFGGPRLAWRIGGKRHYHLGNSHIPTLGKGQSMKTIFKIVIYENLYIVFSLNQPTWVILSPTPNNTLFFVKIPQKCSYDCGGTPPLWIPGKSTQNDPLQMGFCFPL